MTRWQQLERWLIRHGEKPFTVDHLAKSLKIPTWEASALITAYLTAQRGKRSQTAFVLKREGRTRAAVWTIGDTKLDAQGIGGSLFTDVQTKVLNSFAPDLERLADRNPEAAFYARSMIESVVEGAMKLLAVAVRYDEGE